MGNEGKIIAGIFLLFAGFFVLIQVSDNTKLIGLPILGVGLYFILSNLK